MSRLFGWDLPPGVSTSDLPGNSKSDEEEAAFADEVYEMLGNVDDALAQKVYLWADKLRSDSYSEGYRQGRSDECRVWEISEQKRIVCSNTLLHKEGDK